VPKILWPKWHCLQGYSVPDEAQQIEEQKGCFDNFLSNAIENRNDLIETNRNQGTGKIVGGSLLALFAFLIMWGGNRTRRPKEVRIKRN
jgi:hypothetical protein